MLFRSPADLEAETHTVTLLHHLDQVTLSHRTNTRLLNNILVVNSYLLLVEVLNDRLELLIVCLEEGFILDGALIELLLLALLTDSLIRAIVELSDRRIG